MGVPKVFCAGGTAAGPVVGGLTGIDMRRVREGGVLDEATGKWGIRVNRVELKSIDPPKSIIDAMEKQLRAERDKRAAVLTAEGLRQAQILTAEGAKQSAILTAEGQARAQVLLADGQAKAIDTVFAAIHQGRPDPELLAYQYLQVLPKIAEGSGSQVWMIPSELTKALEGFASAFGSSTTTSAGVAHEPTGPPLARVAATGRP